MSTVSIAGAYGQLILDSAGLLHSIRLVDYTARSALAVGLALGLGYSLAELPNSFVKRRLGIRPGARSTVRPRLQYVVDQADSVVGAALALTPLVTPRTAVLAVLVVGLALHIAIDELLYAAGVKRRAPAVAAAVSARGER